MSAFFQLHLMFFYCLITRAREGNRANARGEKKKLDVEFAQQSVNVIDVGGKKVNYSDMTLTPHTKLMGIPQQ